MQKPDVAKTGAFTDRYYITSGRHRETFDGHGPREFGWKCTCGDRSGWFKTPERSETSATRHRQRKHGQV